MKKLIIALVVLVSVITLFLWGLKSFAISIKEQRGCEFANIDNIEINVGVNIPKIENSDCSYDAEQNVKSVYFKFKELNSKEYIIKNKLSKLNDLNDLEEKNMQYFLSDISSITNNPNSIYIKSGNQRNNSHLAVYNAVTNEFWAVVHFKD